MSDFNSPSNNDPNQDGSRADALEEKRRERQAREDLELDHPTKTDRQVGLDDERPRAIRLQVEPSARSPQDLFADLLHGRIGNQVDMPSWVEAARIAMFNHPPEATSVRVSIDTNIAPASVIAEFLASMDMLQRVWGGAGLRFEVENGRLVEG
jgi:hypothetical protein